MNKGCLYVVATPIGHLDDFSQRAITVLKTVDYIAAEDTRHSKRLLNGYEIHTPLLSFHEHNELQQLKTINHLLIQGKSVALISDAGTPLISDPGYRLIATLLEQNIRVIPIPGACAAITALCVSGLPTDRFTFEGFLPVKSAARCRYLKTVANETRTLVFYESTHRIVKSIYDMKTIFGDDRRATIARELTKTFETIHQDNLANLHAWLLSDSNQQKGEFVVLIKGALRSILDEDIHESKRILAILIKEMPLKQAVTLAAQIRQQPRKLLYQLALEIKSD